MDELCEGLRDTLARRENGPVEVIETHISWVFLTQRWALKLKKPVALDFLDFSTARRRKEACEDEVRLNRRLAGGVYVGVLAVERDERAGLRIEEHPTGSAIDWLVKMHRLPADRNLDQLIKTRGLTEEHIEAMAAKLADFYAGLAPMELAGDAYRSRLESLARDNRRVLTTLHDASLKRHIWRIHGAQLQLLQLSNSMFDRRAASCLVDGHGDLRPEHVYFTPEPVVIDCIEFNSEMRQVDVADELSFFEMECKYLGAEWVGQKVAQRCLAALEDDPPPELIRFYKSYRACVRAKVASIRSEQGAGQKADVALQEARRYLSLADHYASGLGKPLLLVVRGLMGTGKSTLAELLSESLGAELVQTDVLRRTVFQTNNRTVDYGEGIYHARNRDRVYEEMFSRTDAALHEGVSVVLDGTFLTCRLRERAASLAAKHRVRFLIVNCHCRDAVVRRRITRRLAHGESASDARPELLDKQRNEEEPVRSDQPQCAVDTTNDPQRLLQTVLRHLRES